MRVFVSFTARKFCNVSTVYRKSIGFYNDATLNNANVVIKLGHNHHRLFDNCFATLNNSNVVIKLCHNHPRLFGNCFSQDSDQLAIQSCQVRTTAEHTAKSTTFWGQGLHKVSTFHRRYISPAAFMEQYNDLHKSNIDA
jgi:hypothetical protein